MESISIHFHPLFQPQKVLFYKKKQQNIAVH